MYELDEIKASKRQNLGEACALCQRQGPKGNAIYFFFSFPALEAAVSGRRASIKSKSKRNSKQESSPKWSVHTLHHRALTSPVVEQSIQCIKLQIASPITNISGGRANEHKIQIASPITQISGGRANEQKCCITDHSNLRWSSKSDLKKCVYVLF